MGNQTQGRYQGKRGNKKHQRIRGITRSTPRGLLAAFREIETERHTRGGVEYEIFVTPHREKKTIYKTKFYTASNGIEIGTTCVEDEFDRPFVRLICHTPYSVLYKALVRKKNGNPIFKIMEATNPSEMRGRTARSEFFRELYTRATWLKEKGEKGLERAKEELSAMRETLLVKEIEKLVENYLGFGEKQLESAL